MAVAVISRTDKKTASKSLRSIIFQVDISKNNAQHNNQKGEKQAKECRRILPRPIKKDRTGSPAQLMMKSNYEKYAEVKQQELLHKERNLQQAISCLRDRRKFASLQCIDSAIDFVADLYDLSIDEVKRAMDGEEYWCI